MSYPELNQAIMAVMADKNPNIVTVGARTRMLCDAEAYLAAEAYINGALDGLAIVSSNDWPTLQNLADVLADIPEED